ncbi:MAG TPA: 3-alpha-hydroxysteroid dehydrogenase [Acidimicrobiaceae bacterium]|jgi:3alpha(or 20beta)-hydroxysteroid dehydrogenase|nr:3-alpha-hydroxysteroid dehydrogenase [Actinomycetota bacterium]MDG1489790.1 glucose 1-dehydrogenase [Actinomycetota bacterium]NCG40559.1 glucose 1-dehydrogenase [Actinomycetota bacterium]HAN08800.1 3-alpha-hydroxysteroid dehydrogenase [Acidimicrobiaceae bacterium]
MSSLRNKVVLITGGARGQGAVEGALFSNLGSTVILTDVLDTEGQNIADSLECTYLHHDVSDESHWERVVTEIVEQFGQIDVLVNNAGIFQGNRMMQTSVEDFQKIMDVNTLGVFLGMKKVGTVMAKQGSGSIINISSVAGLMGTFGSFAYSASKWAVRGMTKSAAKELGRRGVRVNSVHPGYIDTDMLSQVHDFHDDSDRTNKLLQVVPLGRVAAPEEVGNVVVFLASDESGYCTGQEFTVDGGIFS